MDGVGKVELCRKIEWVLASREGHKVLRWFGHMNGLNEYRIARRVLMAEVSGGRVRGRPRLGWMVLSAAKGLPAGGWLSGESGDT